MTLHYIEKYQRYLNINNSLFFLIVNGMFNEIAFQGQSIEQ